MMKFYQMLALSLLIVSNLFAQSMILHAFNNGGGFLSSNASNLEWSMGESVSIASFVSSEYALNTGVLQPQKSIVHAINEYGPNVFGSQITIGPNPATNLLIIKGSFKELGTLSFQLIDAKSVIILAQEIGTMVNYFEKNILMDQYASGVVYLKVFFKPIGGTPKTGLYKIIKL